MSFKILKVSGNSMHPTLESGAFVLLWQSSTLYRNTHDDNKIYKFISNNICSFNQFIYVLIRCKPANHPTSYVNNSRPNVKRTLQLLGGYRLTVGDIVAVNHPKYGQIIKRINELRYIDDKIDNDDIVNNNSDNDKSLKQSVAIKSLRLAGDNPLASVSKEEMGWIDSQNVMGVVLVVINH